MVAQVFRAALECSREAHAALEGVKMAVEKGWPSITLEGDNS